MRSDVQWQKENSWMPSAETKMAEGQKNTFGGGRCIYYLDWWCKRWHSSHCIFSICIVYAYQLQFSKDVFFKRSLALLRMSLKYVIYINTLMVGNVLEPHTYTCSDLAVGSTWLFPTWGSGDRQMWAQARFASSCLWNLRHVTSSLLVPSSSFTRGS